jgi:hypothetical protein
MAAMLQARLAKLIPAVSGAFEDDKFNRVDSSSGLRCSSFAMMTKRSCLFSAYMALNESLVQLSDLIILKVSDAEFRLFLNCSAAIRATSSSNSQTVTWP